jgi:hypothetical protein
MRRRSRTVGLSTRIEVAADTAMVSISGVRDGDIWKRDGGIWKRDGDIGRRRAITGLVGLVKTGIGTGIDTTVEKDGKDSASRSQF